MQCYERAVYLYGFSESWYEDKDREWAFVLDGNQFVSNICLSAYPNDRHKKYFRGCLDLQLSIFI